MAGRPKLVLLVEDSSDLPQNLIPMYRNATMLDKPHQVWCHLSHHGTTFFVITITLSSGFTFMSVVKAALFLRILVSNLVYFEINTQPSLMRLHLHSFSCHQAQSIQVCIHSWSFKINQDWSGLAIFRSKKLRSCSHSFKTKEALFSFNQFQLVAVYFWLHLMNDHGNEELKVPQNLFRLVVCKLLSSRV